MIDWKEWREKYISSLKTENQKNFARIFFHLEDLREEFDLKYQVTDFAKEIVLQIEKGPGYTDEWKKWLVKFANANTKEAGIELFELLVEMKKKRAGE